MKKIFLLILPFCLLSILFIPFLAEAAKDPACAGPDGKYGIVTCGCGTPAMDADGKCTNCCEIGDFFTMAADIYSFIVKYIATTLATIMIIVGAIFMLTSAGDPGRAGTGKNMIKFAIIGLVLVFGSWLIIDSLLKLMGYTQNWQSLS